MYQDDESRAMTQLRLYLCTLGLTGGVVAAGLGVGGLSAGVPWPWPLVALIVASGCLLVSRSCWRKMVAPRFEGKGSAGFVSSSILCLSSAYAFVLSIRSARHIAYFSSSTTQEFLEARWHQVGEQVLGTFLGMCIVSTIWLLFFELRANPLQQLVDEERARRLKQG